MKPARYLLAAGALSLAVPAGASITVLGQSLARDCYEAAASVSQREGLAPQRILREGIESCDAAFSNEALSSEKVVATHVNRGILLMHRGEAARAVADFSRAIAIDPDEPEAYLNKAVAMVRAEQWNEAIPLFDTAIEKKTRRPELAYYGRGIANEMTGDVRGAYYDYKRASALKPDWTRPRAELTRFTVRKR
ncbi:MAG: tetratricopeptide repeat protein [Sphingomonadaceae bacterium]